MCNRYRMSARQAEIAARYGVAGFPADEVYPPPELFPDRPALVVRSDGRARRIDAISWGVTTYVPGKRDPSKKVAKAVTNVRNLASPFWRSMLICPAQRCLVPFTAFSEYGRTRGIDGKLPLHWFDVPSRPILSFAGIWRPTAEKGDAFAMLTTEPNPIVAPIHPAAMPVILHEEDEGRWLSAPWEEARALVAPYPSQLMRLG